MSSNEEYLDNLLKSMEGADGLQGTNGADEMADEDIDALFAAAERILNGELAEDEPAAGGYGTAASEKQVGKEPKGEPQTAAEEPESAVEEDSKKEMEEETEAYPVMETTEDMSQEEIEALLASTQTAGEETEDAVPESEDASQDDLMALLNGLDDNEDLTAIGDLLEAADSGELPVSEENTEAAGMEEEAFFSPDIAIPTEMEEAVEETEDKKKGKPKKEKKPKKQKEPKEPSVPEKPGKRISPKSIVVVVLFAATVFGGIFLSISLFAGELRMQSAKEAFEERDYMTCYEEMYGMDRNEEEEQMFRHAQIVLKMQRRLTIYEKYMGERRELEALDSLMQAVADYDAMYAKAQEYGAGSEVAQLYDRIIQILEENYGLNQDTARAIALCQSNVDYTRYLTALVAGGDISTDGSQSGISLPKEELQDVLPEEEELSQPGFAD